MKLLRTKEETTRIDHRALEMGARLTHPKVEELNKEITNGEIKKTLLSIEGDKSPRLMDIPLDFSSPYGTLLENNLD